MTKTVKVGKMLHHWQAKHWRATQNSIKDKEEELFRVQNSKRRVDADRESRLQQEIFELNRSVEKVWRQKSRET